MRWSSSSSRAIGARARAAMSRSDDAMRAGDDPGRMAVPAEFVEALRELGLIRSSSSIGEPLAGGVSSDIWRVETEVGPVCVKRALARLRVAAEWQAPIERSVYEARWLQVANAALPGAAPEVLGQHERLGVLVMRYLSPAEHRLWKHELRDGNADLATARA